jgi:hypothetical protein
MHIYTGIPRFLDNCDFSSTPQGLFAGIKTLLYLWVYTSHTHKPIYARAYMLAGPYMPAGLHMPAGVCKTISVVALWHVHKTVQCIHAQYTILLGAHTYIHAYIQGLAKVCLRVMMFTQSHERIRACTHTGACRHLPSYIFQASPSRACCPYKHCGYHCSCMSWCVYVRVLVCVCVCVYVHKYTCIVNLSTCTCIHAYKRKYIHLYIYHMCVCVYLSKCRNI